MDLIYLNKKTEMKNLDLLSKMLTTLGIMESTTLNPSVPYCRDVRGASPLLIQLP